MTENLAEQLKTFMEDQKTSLSKAFSMWEERLSSIEQVQESLNEEMKSINKIFNRVEQDSKNGLMSSLSKESRVLLNGVFKKLTNMEKQLLAVQLELGIDPPEQQKQIGRAHV